MLIPEKSVIAIAGIEGISNMNKQLFRDFIQNNIVILDGATGTELKKGVCL